MQSTNLTVEGEGVSRQLVNSMTTFWERVKNGETKIDDALSERAKQINDHVSQLCLPFFLHFFLILLFANLLYSSFLSSNDSLLV